MHPQIVLLDLRLPDIDGIEVCQQILKSDPEIIVLILTAFIDQSLVNACLQAGARGYLVKDAENLHLKEQLTLALKGYDALDPRAATLLADLMRRYPKGGGDTLSLRDLEILRLIAQGLTNREISVKLMLSENTVKGYIKDILAKLGAHNRVEAVLLVKGRGVL